MGMIVLHGRRVKDTSRNRFRAKIASAPDLATARKCRAEGNSVKIDRRRGVRLHSGGGTSKIEAGGPVEFETTEARRKRMEAYLNEKIKEFRKELGIYGQCSLCGHGAVLVQDHDHGNGLVRGRLCSHCNTGLGFFKEDERRLMDAVDYLRAWRVAHMGYTAEQKKIYKYRPGKKGIYEQ